MRLLRLTLVAAYVLLVAALLLLRQCGPAETPRADTAPPRDLIDRAERTGQRGKLKVTLLWNHKADLDLHVVPPGGHEIFYDNKRDPVTGGYLDVDNIHGGNGSAENIYWDNPPTGQYEVSVVYYNPRPEGSAPRRGTCTVVVFNGDLPPVSYTVSISGELRTKIPVTTVRFGQIADAAE